MSATQTPALDMDKLNQFIGQFVTDINQLFGGFRERLVHREVTLAGTLIMLPPRAPRLASFWAMGTLRPVELENP